MEERLEEGMDLTPDTVRRVAFRESWRGYNQIDVDHFIDWVATGLEAMADAGIGPSPAPPVAAVPAVPRGELQPSAVTRVRPVAPEPVAARPVAPGPVAPGPVAPGPALAGPAEVGAAALGVAERRAQAIVARAERDAAELTERVHTHLREEVAALEGKRDLLREEVDALTRYLADERVRLRQALATTARQLSQELRLGGPAGETAQSGQGPVAQGPIPHAPVEDSAAGPVRDQRRETWGPPPAGPLPRTRPSRHR